MSLYLSKSKYCNAIQCPKMLWMKNREEYMDKFDDSVLNEAVLENGNAVGDLAMGLFGEYTEIPYGDIPEMIQNTQEEISKGTHIIAEASFSYDGLFCSIDILRKAEDGSFEIYEVKSSTEVKSIYKDDAAYQFYVVKKLGYDVSKVCIVHINNGYERYGELNLNELFHIEDVTSDVRKKYDEVESNISILEEYMRQEEEPTRALGQHCFRPYKCGFFKYCSRHLPTPNVFDIAGMQTRTKLKLYSSGFVSFEDVYKKGDINHKHMVQIEHQLKCLEDKIDIDIIKDFVDDFYFPLYFLDFETYQEAIPPFDGCSPYEQIPFQYSLHILYEDGKLEHKEFLAAPNSDPRRTLAERLCEDIPVGSCAVSYNMAFEKGRINKLAKLYPDLSEQLLSINENMKDLMIVFSNKNYYKREMEGSYSIKKVLPALFPNDPELDYSNLPGVKKGDQASAAFKEMANTTPEEVARIREELLAYCKLDTYAMVKIWEKLVGAL